MFIEWRLASARSGEASTEDTIDQTPLFHAIVSHRCRAIYFPIPKAGCSTIKALLRGAAGLPAARSLAELHDRERNGLIYPHMISMEDFHWMLHSDLEQDQHYLSFTICRNPYVRLASAYVDKVAGKEGDAGDQAGSIDQMRWRLYKATGALPVTLSFEDFVTAIELSRTRDLNRHWQHQHVLACVKLRRPDWCVKLEELPAKWRTLVRKLGLPDSDPPERLNATGAGARLKDLYTPALASRVHALYAADFRNFKYDEALPV